MISSHLHGHNAPQNSHNLYGSDILPPPRSTESHLRPYQQHTPHPPYPINAQRSVTPSLGHRYPQQSDSLPRHRPASSLGSSRNSTKRPASAHHSSYSSQQSQSTGPFPSLTAHSGLGINYPSQLDTTGISIMPHDSQRPSIQVPSQSRNPPHAHLRVQSMSVAPSNQQPYIPHSATYPPTSVNASMYAGQSQPLSMSMGSSIQNGYCDPVSSSLYHYQGSTQTTVQIPDSNQSQTRHSPLSPVTPTHGHFPGSQSQVPSASPSPNTTPGSTPSLRPRAGTVGTFTTLPPISFPASPARPFECDQCRLSFVRHHDLKRHKETHSGGRPHICTACGKSYTRKDALVRHQVVKQCGEGSSKSRRKSESS